jgi:dihydrodipicolinate synthase/N-acetylneuraminate lyase
VPVILGTTGRGRLILNHDLSQAKKLVDLGIELAQKHGRPLVVGTGAETRERAVDLTSYAGSRDVFAVLVTAPIYASSAFAQSLAKSPMAPEYQVRLAEEYFKKILQAIPGGSSTIFLPYIFPTLTDADPRVYLRPEILEKLHEHAAASGHPMNGGKLTLRDEMVPLEYSERCPELSFLAGMESTVQVFLANPRLKFSGAILGSGNLIPKFLRTHVHDCLRLRELRRREPGSEEEASFLRATISQQNQVNALFNHLWESGLFGALIHGFLGIGSPFQGSGVSSGELSAWARMIANDAPSLVPEVTSYCPESPLSRELLKQVPGKSKRPAKSRGG